MQLPLKINRHLGVSEGKEVYHIPKKEMSFELIPSKTIVNADLLLRCHEDAVFQGEYIRKVGWKQTGYNMPQDSLFKVNKNIRLWDIDLDREQYNHLRIPVNRNLSFAASAFHQYRRPDFEGVDEDKYIKKECTIPQNYRPGLKHIIPIFDTPTQPQNVRILDTKAILHQSNLKAREKREEDRMIDESKIRDKKSILHRSNLKGREKCLTDRIGDESKLHDKKQIFVGTSLKGILKHDAWVPSVTINDTLCVMSGECNKRQKIYAESRRPVKTVESYKDKVDMFPVTGRIVTFDRY